MAHLTLFVTAYARKGGLIAMFLMTIFAGSILARQTTVPATEATVASKRTEDLTIRITSANGKMKGRDNSFCVVFQKRDTEEPVDVQNVSVDFTLLVGKIQERPIRAQLAGDRAGRHCGHVDLGKQYYVPASY